MATISSLYKFLKEDIWHEPYDPKRPFRSFFVKILRICIETARRFERDDCFLKASALTYYSLLSIVPALAIGFGIAKGFGFSQVLEREIHGQFHEQPEIADKMIAFAYNLLAQAQGGVIAGVGIITLFWTVIKLLENIEISLNDIWKVPAPRSLARKFSDYLAIMIFCPIFFFISSSTTIFITTQVMKATKTISYLGAFRAWIFFSLHLIPYLLTWLSFSFVYIFMPNTKVPWRYAILAGIAAGTIFQLTQLIYIKFQIGVSSYGPIYGSLAAIPLFLVWLNLSWIIVLLGAEIACTSEEDKLNHYTPDDIGKNRVLASKHILGLLIVDYIVQAFAKGSPPISVPYLSRKLGAAEKNIRQVTEELALAGVLSEVKSDVSFECYQPARDVKDITLKYVFDALDQARHPRISIFSSEEYNKMEKAINAFEAAADKSKSNIILKDLS